jgi:hypothetical protein
MDLPRNYVGRCIYCDSTENLTREHVIPEGIGGRIVPLGQHEAFVLRDATCDACKKITAATEGKVLRKMMGHFRASRGMVRKDRRTKTRRVEMDDGSFVDLPIDQLPGVLFLPCYGMPGFLEGRPVGSPAPLRFHTVVLDEDRLPETGTMKLAGMGPDIFGQMLAKIALGFAVWSFGLDSFRPLVREFILGDVKQFGHWLGGEALQRSDSVEPDPNALHHLDTAFIEHDGKIYVVGGVWLFADYGGPRNYVVVGEFLRGRSGEAGDGPSDQGSD